MENITRLIAIEEVKMVRSRYFRFGDLKDLTGMRALFADDCIVDLRGAVTDPSTGKQLLPAIGNEVLTGIEAVMAAYGQNEGFVTVHHGYNPEVEILSEASARSTWAMTDRIFFDADNPVQSLTGYGHYHETFEKIAGIWKIKTLRLTRLRVEVVHRNRTRA